MYLKLRKFVEDNINKLNWSMLSVNLNAIALLEANQDKINWGGISSNSNIFEYDYQAMKKHMYSSGLCKELIANRFVP